MARVLFLLLTVSLALPWSTASAQKMYKWVDSNGKVSYHDRPPPANSEFTVQETRIKGAREPGSDAAEDAAQKNPVVLYAVPKCPACDAARTYLKSRNVPFADKNVENDPKLQQELKAKAGGLSVPTIMVGTKVLNGYLESLLAGELDQAGYPKIADKDADKEKSADKPADEGFKAPTQ
ncbi:MAG TPA: glutaredoxin family protein [Burkholderiales bacterium]|nr:glutaredoxin family protein [Burkholderiales bacterium]